MQTSFYDVSLSAAYTVSFEQKPRNRVHRHSFFEPCIVVSGSGEFEHGGALHSLRPGDLFIADPGIFHEIRSLQTRDLILYFFAFGVGRADQRSESHAPSFDEGAWAAFTACHRNHQSGQFHLLPLFQHVADLGSASESVRQQFQRQASLLLMNQVIAALTVPMEEVDQPDDAYGLTRRVIAAIEENLHQPIRIEELAAQCHVSGRSLRRHWSRLAERSLTDEIAWRRIERATRLLLLPDISVAEVGYQVGIDSPALFSRMFKAIMGVTPTAFRRKHWQAETPVQRGGLPFRSEFIDGEYKEHLTASTARA